MLFRSDEGAQRSFITKDLADELGAKPVSKHSVSMSSFGATEQLLRRLDVTTTNVITEKGDEIPLQVLVVPHIATPLKCQHNADINNMPHLKGLKLAHPVSSGNFSINVLIGADHYWDIVQDTIIRGEKGPTAMQSKLGFLLSGPIGSRGKKGSVTKILHIAAHKEEEFDLKQFWSIESLGILPDDNPSDKSFLANYQATSITRDIDGAYIAGFPWKEEHPPLPSNLTICERRTRALTRRLQQTPELLKCYNDIIKEQDARGFIEKVNNSQPSDRAHYLPHHPVKKDSSTTPIRIVFDCSCQQAPSSPSLNDCLEVGPPYLADMGSLLVRFRTHQIGISTDIEKAFQHVRLSDTDRDMTRFLWLSDADDPESAFHTYRFRSVLFGSVSSPFMLNAVIRTHLDSHDTPVTKDLKENLYVDNIVTGCDTDKDALSYYEHSRSVMADAKFNLRSWASNSQPLQDQASADGVLDPETNNANVLGLRWDTTSDTLTLAFKDLSPSIHDSPITKREISRESSKIYDPLGLVAPISINTKILMQDIWKLNIDWDMPLEREIRDRWLNISRDIKECTSVTIPRSYFSSHSVDETTQLHVFVDASPKAYGAVAYVRQALQTSFVMAKSRVAPLKQLSLPRLELMAALVGTKLAEFSRNALSKKFPDIKVTLWSDSQIVLHWLQSNKRLQQFVRNRVNEIKHLFPSTCW